MARYYRECSAGSLTWRSGRVDFGSGMDNDGGDRSNPTTAAGTVKRIIPKMIHLSVLTLGIIHVNIRRIDIVNCTF